MKTPKWVDENGVVLDPQPTVEQIKSWGGEPRISDYENTIKVERNRYDQLVAECQSFLKDAYSLNRAFTLSPVEYRAFEQLKQVVSSNINTHNQQYMKLVATVLPPDPNEEREGVYFSRVDWDTINRLPSGTQLYVAIGSASPITNLKQS